MINQDKNIYNDANYYTVEDEIIERYLFHISSRQITINGAKTFSKKVLNRCNIFTHYPILTFSSEERFTEPDGFEFRGAYYPKLNEIRLSSLGCNKIILLHELCHTISHHYYGKLKYEHGKEYIGIYIYVLNEIFGINKTKLKRFFAKNKMQFVPFLW